MNFARDAAELSTEIRAESAGGHQLVSVRAAADFRFAASPAGVPGEGEIAPIPAGYWVSRTPVTNAQYARHVLTRGDTAVGADDVPVGDDPITGVSGRDAKRYCAWLNAQQLGWRFRLLTEAEWENAARAGLLRPVSDLWEWTATEVRDADTRDVRLPRAIIRGTRMAGSAGRSEVRAFDRGHDTIGFRIAADRR